MNPILHPPGLRVPEYVRRYFVSPPDDNDRSVGSGLLFGGLAALVLGWVIPLSLASSTADSDSYSSGSGGIGQVLFAVGLWLVGNIAAWYLIRFAVARLYRYNRQLNAGRGAPSNVEMERWLKEDCAEILKRAEAELDVPHDDRRQRDPLLVMGPALPTDFAHGDDGVPRFASYEAAVVIISKGFVSVFSCVLNALTGTIDLEATNEFPLGQVTSIGTFNDRLASHGAGPTDGRSVRMEGSIAIRYLSPADVSVRQEFRIVLTSGDFVAVSIGCHVNGVNVTREGARTRVTKALKALRTSIREVGRGVPTGPDQ